MGTRRRRGRGEGGIEQLPSGSWRATWKGKDAAGRPIRERKVFAELTDARRWLAERQLKGRPAAVGTLGDWLTTWLELHAVKVGPATFRTDRQTAERHIRPHLGGTRLRDLTSLRIEQWLASLSAAGVTQGERHKAGKTLRNVLNAAVRTDLLPVNPMHGRVRVPGAPKPRVRVLTPDELRRLLDAADRLGHGALFRLWVELGLRPGELIGLRWDDYDPERGTVRIERSIEMNTHKIVPPKTPRETPLPLSAGTRAVLDAYRAGRTTGIMFSTSRGWYWWAGNFRDHIWRPVIRAAGFRNLSRYAIRHTCASLLLSRGTNIVVIARRLGHANPAITLRVYSHLMPDDQARAAGVWDTFFSEPSDPR